MELIRLHREKLIDLHRRAVQALQQLGDEDVNWRPNAESNSIANLAVHMAGNLRQRLLSGLCGEPDLRDRDAEFNDRAFHSRDQVVELLDAAFGEAERIIGGLAPERLGEPQQIRSRTVTVLEMLFTVVTHMSEHVGQILYIAKVRKGPGYRVLSIPHKRS